ncbi:MAG TPA: FMN-binding protein [Candidatus Brocadiia bacterium]|nr:FMN-binding protein [Candidatus Brocadiia bacterium]
MEDSEKKSQPAGLAQPSRLGDGARCVLFMVAACAVFVGAIAGVKLALAGRIRLNESLLEQRQRLEALGVIDWRQAPPPAEEIARLYAQRVKERPATKDSPAFFAAVDPQGAPQAIAFITTWQGFWGPITAMIALDPKAEKIRGVSFLKQGETPGLGARITEPPFRRQFFEGAKTIPGVSGPATVLVPEDRANPKPNEINAITGATRTSDTFVQLMNQQLPAEVRALQPRLKEVK